MINSSLQIPAAFIGHGSPMNTLDKNRFTEAWRELGRTMPRPRAILAISAHWFINGSAVTAMQSPRVIHDFYGFPKPLFDFGYPAPGAPDEAQEIADVVRPSTIALDHDSWGIDHGTWSVLAHIFPKADIPVVQLSIHAGEDMQYHLDLGARFAPLRERDIFILGSGNVVHNLRQMDWHLGQRAFDWAEDFDSAIRQTMTTRPADLVRAVNHPAYRRAVPTPEHFLPLAYFAGLCTAAGQPAEVLVDGGSMGSLTMTSYVLGCDSVKDVATEAAAAPASNPPDLPLDQTNM